MVDVEWYSKHYSAVEREIAGGRAADAAEHYERFGKARGYLPHAGARRANNAANYPSRFGGLWTDLANAHDLVKGKLQLGWIDEQEADLLTHWIDEGYVTIPAVLSGRELEVAQQELDSIYRGGVANQLFDCVADSSIPVTFRDVHATLPTKALCVHWLNPGLRDAMFAKKIVRFLNLVFERPAMVSQTLGFYRGSEQGGHQDSAFVGYTLPLQFAASWIALTDVKPTAGELFFYPRSHRIEPFLFGGDYKNDSEMRRFRTLDDVEAEKLRYDAATVAKIAPLQKSSFLPKAGDALIWSADLVHGGNTVSSGLTRQSLVSHYCPAELAPLYFEHGERKIVRHDSGNCYTTYNYSILDHITK